MQSANFEIPSLNTDFGKKLPITGSLIKIPAYIVILNCFKNKFSGRIIFENKQRIKHVYFDQGNILNIHSNLQDESFKNIILKKQLLEYEKTKKVAVKLDEIEAFRKENILEHHEQAKYLLNLDDEQVKSIEKHVCLEKLLDLLGWFQGEYLIQENYSHNIPEIQFGVYLEILYKNLQNFFLHALPLFEQHYQSPKLEKSKFKDKNQLILTCISNVLSSLSYYNATGILTLHKDDFIKKITFKNGNIHHIHSNKPHESLKTTLLRWNFLSSEKINYVSSYSDTELEKLLLEDKSLTQQTLEQAKKILMFEQYLQIFHWKVGHYHFQGDLSANDTQPLPFDLQDPKYSAHQDILKTINTLKKDSIFIVFKKNLSLFKTLCENIGFSAIESSFLDNEEFTIAQDPLLGVSTQNLHYMIWEKLLFYTSQPTSVVCVLHKSLDANFLKEIQQTLKENSIDNLGFFVLN
ncbi:MAG TPA: hypothetical protein PKC21_01045 [Oligoflexia bacterium]|nr:hypothetical protein [Oligoflexia bacterium]HMR23915.1 hypothetical protein [Oligoflexia bacterium]